MPGPWRRRLLALLLIAAAMTGGRACAEPVYYFSVLNQRSPVLTAEYWNPMLEYVSKKAGVELRLRMGKTAPETTALTLRGEAQFAYTNHLFLPERVKLGWRVIARPDTDGIRGQIVVPAGSAVNRLEDLAGQTVAFPSAEAFAGYQLPMDALLRRQIQVQAVFAGNQEGAMGQLKAGRAAAAGVNEDLMAAFSVREKFPYRVLWSSENYLDLPIMVSPAVPRAVAAAVARAFVGMRADPEGARILRAGAARLGLGHAVGFRAADDGDYANYRDFYRTALLR
jgi:phosphonate transport system substrate-binding protein